MAFLQILSCQVHRVTVLIPDLLLSNSHLHARAAPYPPSCTCEHWRTPTSSFFCFCFWLGCVFREAAPRDWIREMHGWIHGRSNYSAMREEINYGVNCPRFLFDSVATKPKVERRTLNPRCISSRLPNADSPRLKPLDLFLLLRCLCHFQLKLATLGVPSDIFNPS
jgi:hypothetical protein